MAISNYLAELISQIVKLDGQDSYPQNFYIQFIAKKIYFWLISSDKTALLGAVIDWITKAHYVHLNNVERHLHF